MKPDASVQKQPINDDMVCVSRDCWSQRTNTHAAIVSAPPLSPVAIPHHAQDGMTMPI